MRGSGMARVEYRLSAPTHPLCFLRKWQSGVPKKNPNLVMRTSEHEDSMAGTREKGLDPNDEARKNDQMTNHREIAPSPLEIGTLSVLARLRICLPDLGSQRSQPAPDETE